MIKPIFALQKDTIKLLPISTKNGFDLQGLLTFYISYYFTASLRVKAKVSRSSDGPSLWWLVHPVVRALTPETKEIN